MRALNILLILILPLASAYTGYSTEQRFTLSSQQLSFTDAEQNRTLNITAMDGAVYYKGHYSFGDGTWHEFTFDQPMTDGWIMGTASKSLQVPQGTSEDNYIIIYSCTKGAAWDCHGEKWQIRQFTTTSSSYPTTATVVGVSASTHDGHLPAWTLDGDFSEESRWSGKGDGVWIKYELNWTAIVSDISIAAWDEPCYFLFDILVSLDGSTWTQVYSGHSDGLNSGLERFTFAPVPARYVRILGHGNNISLWNSYLEIRIEEFPIDLDVTGDGGSCTGDIFDIHYEQDFEDDTLGAYDYNEWREDWNHPPWETNGEMVIERCTDPEQPSKVVRFDFPEESWGLNSGTGGQWFTYFDEQHEEIYLSYRLRLKPGFEPVLSGKFPGLLGKPEWASGPPAYDDGFIAKLSWAQGYDQEWQDIAAYIYHHDMEGEYGDPFRLYTGLDDTRWITLTQRIVMNTVDEEGGNYDGIYEVFYDSVLIFQITDMRFREVPGVGIDMLHFAVFFGGGDESFATIRDEWIKFDDFVAFTYKDCVDVPRGNEPSLEGWVLELPS